PLGDGVRQQPFDPLAAQQHLSAIRALEAGDDVEERTLAGPVRSDEPDDGTRRHLEADAVQNGQRKGLAELLDPQERHGACDRSSHIRLRVAAGSYGESAMISADASLSR